MREKKKCRLVLVVMGIGCLISSFAAAQINGPSFDSAAHLLRMGRYAEALALYDRLATVAGAKEITAHARLLKAVATGLYLGQTDKALGLFQKIRVDYPDSQAASDALFHMGMMLYGQKKYSAADNIFAMYIEQYPDGFRRAAAVSWKTHVGTRIRTLAKDRGPALSDIRPHTKIRVRVMDGAEQIAVAADGRIFIWDTKSAKLLFRGKGPIGLTHDRGKMKLNHQPLTGRQFRIETDGPYLSCGNLRLRGMIMIAIEPDGLQAINHIPVEQYLYGIVSREMPPSWPADALKAQAVASRTYALYLTGKGRLMPFDVEAGTASQVYGGYDAETSRTNAAVDATRGQVLTYDSHLIIAYFHSNSAGHTEDAKDVWQVKLPYLKGLPDCFSKDLPNSRWEYHLPYDVAAVRLNRAGLNVGSIYEIRESSVSPTGRILKIAVTSDRGTIDVSANHFRCLLDATQIKSTFFNIIPSSAGVLLKGEGHGHGVGMSQWGANQMARAGYSHVEILKHYYPSAELAVIDNI